MTNSRTLPGEHQSLWLATTPHGNYPSLSEDLRVDVAVVGGGIAAAYHCSAPEAARQTRGSDRGQARGRACDGPHDGQDHVAAHPHL